MGQLQFKDGQLLFHDGKLAMDPNCCCQPDDCSINWTEFTDQGFIAGGQDGALRTYSDPGDVAASPWSLLTNPWGLRLDWEDSYDPAPRVGPGCATYNPNTQLATATGEFVLATTGWVKIDWVGLGEVQDSNYELMELQVDGLPVAFAHAPGGGRGCDAPEAIVTDPAPPVFFALDAGTHTVTVLATTNDQLYHVGAYYQFSFLCGLEPPEPIDCCESVAGFLKITPLGDCQFELCASIGEHPDCTQPIIEWQYTDPDAPACEFTDGCLCSQLVGMTGGCTPCGGGLADGECVTITAGRYTLIRWRIRNNVDGTCECDGEWAATELLSCNDCDCCTDAIVGAIITVDGWLAANPDGCLTGICSELNGSYFVPTQAPGDGGTNCRGEMYFPIGPLDCGNELHCVLHGVTVSWHLSCNDPDFKDSFEVRIIPDFTCDLSDEVEMYVQARYDWDLIGDPPWPCKELFSGPMICWISDTPNCGSLWDGLTCNPEFGSISIEFITEPRAA